MKGLELEEARKVLGTLNAKDPERFFQVPVDTTFLKDYLEVIERPMDLGTIATRLGEYRDARSFAADVRLVFENSMTYCGPRAELKHIYGKAKRLLKVFQQESEKSLKRFLDRPPPRKKVAMRNGVAEAAGAMVVRLKKHKYGRIFSESIDETAPPDYPSRVEVAMDLGKLEAKLKKGEYERDAGAWVLDARRIGANCVRYNTHPGEWRMAGLAFAAAVEKELEAKLKPALRLEGGVEAVELACPRLLDNWGDIIAKIEAGFMFNSYTAEGIQRAYAFFHPIASYYDSRDAIDEYLRAVPDPVSIGEIVAKIMQGGDYASVADVDSDVKRIFSNCQRFFGPNGVGRRAHGDADADALCDLSANFERRWREMVDPLLDAERKRAAAAVSSSTTSSSTSSSSSPYAGGGVPPAANHSAPAMADKKFSSSSFSSSGKKPRSAAAGGKALALAGKSLGMKEAVTPVVLSDSEEPPPPAKAKAKKSTSTSGRKAAAPDKAVEAAMWAILAAIKEHRMKDGWATATPFLSKAVFPKNREEYAAAIGGMNQAADLGSVEAELRRGAFESLEAFGREVRRCLDNARAWKTALERYHRDGVLEERGLSEADVKQARESWRYAAILKNVLEDKLDEDVETLASTTKNGRRAPAEASAPSAAVASKKRKAPKPAPDRKKLAASPTPSAAKRVRAESSPPPPPDDDDVEEAGNGDVGQSAASGGGGDDDDKVNKNNNDGENSISTATSKKKGKSAGTKVPPWPTAAESSSSSGGGAPPAEPWRAAADRIYNKLSRHDWVRLDGEFGRGVMWHIPAVEAFPAIKDAYLAKISDPMDLGQISARLRTHAYSAPEAFAEDMVLVFDNAVAYNEDAKKAPRVGGEVEFAVKVYDVATHLRDWSLHLSLEYLIEADAKTAGSTKRGDYVCAVTASELRESRCRDELEARKARDARANADLSSAALENFVTTAASESAAPAPATEAPEADESESKKKKKKKNIALSWERRLAARRRRDEVVWPSRLGFNKDAARDARLVLKALRKQQLKKYSQWFDKPVEVFDYAQFVAEPTCLDAIEQRLNQSTAERKAGQRIDAEPYESLADFALELRRVFSNAVAYNGRFRDRSGTQGFHVMKAVDVLTPVLEDALFALAVDAYERIGRDRVVNLWTQSKVDDINRRVQERREIQAEIRRDLEDKIEQRVEERFTSTKKMRERQLRYLMRNAVESLDVLPDSADVSAPSPARPRAADGGAAAEPVLGSAAHLLVDDDRERRLRDDRGARRAKIADAVFAAAPPLQNKTTLLADLDDDDDQKRRPEDLREDRKPPVQKRFQPFALGDERRLSSRGQNRRRLLVRQRKPPPGFDDDDDDAVVVEPKREKPTTKRRRVDRAVLVLTEEDQEPRPPADAVVDASEGDTDWFELATRPDLQARVLVAIVEDDDDDDDESFVRCCVLLRRVDDGDLRDDRGLVAFETTTTTTTSLVDAVVAARAYNRRRRMHRGLGGWDLLAIADAPPDALVAELASLPYALVGESLAATPPLPSRRAGAAHLERFILAPTGSLRLVVDQNRVLLDDLAC
ncbi:hypothetical protein CTAYLR_001193 [Chrysophaeum taylorii]|uniref:Bromo domain-containing protein n=1 Tax=Chrysophaeum taylorii TaxID=2483200 RepID=A0AAD7UEF7_9STRA|nr:hypothetical protein CTAYLR_001193 [Chrysophaeum taylorii]